MVSCSKAQGYPAPGDGVSSGFPAPGDGVHLGYPTPGDGVQAGYPTPGDGAQVGYPTPGDGVQAGFKEARQDQVSSTTSRQGRLGQDGADNKVRSFTHPSGVLFNSSFVPPGHAAHDRASGTI